MANINGQEISKTVNGWVVDGVQAYLSRDGVSLVTGSGKKLAVLTETEIVGFRRQEDELQAARKAPVTSRVAKERDFDRGYNEGGEGFNPYRHGSAKTYSR